MKKEVIILLFCIYLLGFLTAFGIFSNLIEKKKIIKDPLFIYPDFTIQNYYDVNSCIGVISKKDLQGFLKEKEKIPFQKRR